MKIEIFKNCKLSEERQSEIITMKEKYNSMKGSKKHKYMFDLFQKFNEEEKEAFNYLPTRVNFSEGWNNND